jgi:hypothetical protein
MNATSPTMPIPRNNTASATGSYSSYVGLYAMLQPISRCCARKSISAHEGASPYDECHGCAKIHGVAVLGLAERRLR